MMKLRSKLFCSFALASVLGLGQTAQAQSTNPVGYAGGLLGLNVPSQDNTSGRMTFGGHAGVLFGEAMFGVGAFFLAAPGDVDYFTYGAEARYEARDIVDGFWFGAKMGFTKATTLAKTSSTGVAVGPAFGYDYLFENGLSVGGEGNLLFVFDDDTYNHFNVLASVKYWF